VIGNCETAGDATRTRNVQLGRQTVAGSKAGPDQALTSGENPVCTPVCTSSPENAHDEASERPAAQQLDADLELIRKQWPTLPDAFRKGIIAMIQAAATQGGKP
jgi:hypothetical protein